MNNSMDCVLWRLGVYFNIGECVAYKSIERR